MELQPQVSQGTFEFCKSSDAETQSNGVVSLSLSVLMGPVTGDGFAQSLLFDFPKGVLCPLVVSVYRYLAELSAVCRFLFYIAVALRIVIFYITCIYTRSAPDRLSLRPPP